MDEARFVVRPSAVVSRARNSLRRFPRTATCRCGRVVGGSPVIESHSHLDSLVQSWNEIAALRRLGGLNWLAERWSIHAETGLSSKLRLHLPYDTSSLHIHKLLVGPLTTLAVHPLVLSLPRLQRRPRATTAPVLATPTLTPPPHVLKKT